jgi:NAD(P)-dependent dehydrogenase (short-subunit alcohol dehydrogenase family)
VCKCTILFLFTKKNLKYFLLSGLLWLFAALYLSLLPMKTRFDFNEKRLLITGASSGIGRAIAITAAECGAKLIIIGRDAARLTETFNLLPGEDHQMFCGDLCKDDFIQEIVANVQKIDGLVHCAGMMFLHPIRFIGREELEKMYSINLHAPILLTSALVSKKKFNTGSSVVFMSSVSGTRKSFYGGALYGSSKSALEAFSATLALEQASKGIRSNCIAAGLVTTPMAEQYLGDSESESAKIYEKQYPLGFGKADDVTSACLYLLSDDSRWVTGTVLTLDGGHLLS